MSVLIKFVAVIVQGGFVYNSAKVLFPNQKGIKEKRDKVEKTRVKLLEVFDSQPQNIAKDALV